MRFSMLTTGLLLTSSLLLVGCNSEPSSSDMQKAMETVYNSNPITAAMAKSLSNFEKMACKAAEGKPGYVCDYKVTATLAEGIATTSNHTARFVKGDNGWEMLEN